MPSLRAFTRNCSGRQPENLHLHLLYEEGRDPEDLMSGDSVPFVLPLSHCATGSEATATTLYRELRKPLLRYLAGLGLSADEAQDIVQDAFLSLHQHLAGGGSQENIRSWLFRVAHNAARNRQNRYERRFAAPLEDGFDSASEQATPEGVVLEKEKFHRLRQAIKLLTATERECLLLRAGGLRYREIGEVLGLSISTVGDTVDRAVRKLAEKCNV
jgi:RNA polymerase sigma-70 factor (ECF subfamily)